MGGPGGKARGPDQGRYAVGCSGAVRRFQAALRPTGSAGHGCEREAGEVARGEDRGRNTSGAYCCNTCGTKAGMRNRRQRCRTVGAETNGE